MKKSIKPQASGRKTTAALAATGLVFISPVLITIILSFRFENSTPTLTQYYELLITNYTFLRYFWNSLLYSLCVTALCITISFPLGFLFAKVAFPGRNALFFVYIITMMLPFQATLLPNYIQLRDFGLLDTRAALILPLAFSPFAVFLFRQFIKSVPSEILDCTTLETSSAFGILRHAVFPYVKPAAMALAVLVFCESWNMVEPVIIFTANNPDIHPLSVTLGDLPGNVSFSAAAVYLFPIIFLFLLFRETLSSSLEHYRWD